MFKSLSVLCLSFFGFVLKELLRYYAFSVLHIYGSFFETDVVRSGKIS